MFCRKLVSTIKISFATDLLWSICGNLLGIKPNHWQWIIILCKNPCASTGNYLFEIQMLLQHANESVSTNHHHSAGIIIHHQLLLVKVMSLWQKRALYRLHYYDMTVLLAVQSLDLKVRVEVEDNALWGLRRCDDPVTVLVRWVLEWIARGGDVSRLAGI